MKELLDHYTKYNYWANKQTMDWLAELDESVLTQEITSSFTSICRTIQHISNSQKFWLEFVTKGNPTEFSWKNKEGTSAEILQDWDTSSLDMKTSFLNFDEEALMQKITLDQPWSNKTRCRYEFVMHVINHSTFHRGQLISMARGLGVKEAIRNTDFIAYNPSESTV